jgi:hypothetical protein
MFTRKTSTGLLSIEFAAREQRLLSCRSHHSCHRPKSALPAHRSRKPSTKPVAFYEHLTGLSFLSSIKTHTSRMGSTTKDMKASAVFPAEEAMFMRTPSRRSVVHSTKGMVACTQPLAAEAGQRILRMGGNAAVRDHIHWPASSRLTEF